MSAGRARATVSICLRLRCKSRVIGQASRRAVHAEIVEAAIALYYKNGFSGRRQDARPVREVRALRCQRLQLRDFVAEAAAETDDPSAVVLALVPPVYVPSAAVSRLR